MLGYAEIINICQPSGFLYPSPKHIAQQARLKGDRSIDERNAIAFSSGSIKN
jgi:hypothetical protein